MFVFFLFLKFYNSFVLIGYYFNIYDMFLDVSIIKILHAGTLVHQSI